MIPRPSRAVGFKAKGKLPPATEHGGADVVIPLSGRTGEHHHACALCLKRRKGEGKGNEQAVIA